MNIIHRPQVAFAQRTRRKELDLDAALSAVSPAVRDAAREAAQELTRLGIRHVLCGGLAVGAYGYPRATKDVDFLVGDEAFEHHGTIVTLRAPFQVRGVAVDSVPVPSESPFLAKELDRYRPGEGPSVVSLGALVFMKLLAGRKRDIADITELMKAGADAVAVEDYLALHASDRLEEFRRILREAEAEAP